MTHLPWLSWLVFFPLLGAVVVAVAPERFARTLATLFAAAEVAFAVPLWWKLDLHHSGWQFVENRPWIPQWGARYALAIDGLSVLLVLLTVVLSLIAIVGAFSAVNQRAKEFFALLLALETGMIGTFLCTDVLLFYVFWEAMLIPMYLLIGVWGGQRRIYAAVKFFLYTMAGSVLMLASILWMYFHVKAATGVPTFSLDAWYALPLAPASQFWLFLAFAFAFAIKVPMFPFHTWLPDAHVEAPTAGSVILAGVLLKMGTYGLLRFAFPLFPDAAAYFSPLLATLAVIGIVYGALVAMVQPDMKKLVAYSSVSHLGFVVLGITAMNIQGMQGAVYQMLSHGVSTGGLFLLVGMLVDRRHTRLISEFGGLKHVAPKLVAAFFIITLASIGLPGLAGFVGEFLILFGAFRWNVTFAVVAASGVILSAVYMLWMFQRVNYGPVTNPKNEKMADLSTREKWVLWPVIAMAVFMGVAPWVFLNPMKPAVNRIVARMAEAEPKKVVEIQKMGSDPISVGGR